MENLMPFILIIGVIAIMYIFMIRPQKKKEKEEAAMRDAVQVGDEVTTIGGIIGKVVSVKGETFVLETTRDKTKIRFLKGAIRSVDVRAADIAAAILETKEADATEKDEDTVAESETLVDGKPLSKRAARKARREAAAAAAEESREAVAEETVADETPAEETPVEQPPAEETVAEPTEEKKED
ncbi:MAG: preprotein translocase subunit YajC [Clostridia bacterium]|nr:preprotein translocase subunit YajC [Clostridia bacterium]